MTVKNGIEEVIKYLPREIKRIIENISNEIIGEIEEIRLRGGAPLMVELRGEGCFITKDGGFCNNEDKAYIVSAEEIQKAFLSICENSIYAYTDEIRQGFITIKGGNRVGICGKAVIENNGIKTFKEISSLNFRIAREVVGAADGIVDKVVFSKKIYNTLIVSPPGWGKTTLLRDLTRLISNKGFKVGIVDDRGEIAALYNGIPQNNVGVQTDVLDNISKSQGTLMLLKTMSPNVIINDEIASEDDVAAINLAFGTGVSIIATTHGSRLEEVMERTVLKPLFLNGVFKKVLIIERNYSSEKFSKIKMVNI